MEELTTTVPCISSNAKLGVGIGGDDIPSASVDNEGKAVFSESTASSVLAFSLTSSEFNSAEVVGGVHKGEKAPVALPGLMKKRESYSKASNLIQETTITIHQE